MENTELILHRLMYASYRIGAAIEALHNGDISRANRHIHSFRNKYKLLERAKLDIDFQLAFNELKRDYELFNDMYADMRDVDLHAPSYE